MSTSYPPFFHLAAAISGYWFDIEATQPSPATKTKPRTKSQSKKFIVCASCKHAITKPSEKIEIYNQVHHQYTNPFGIRFNITCFKEALGCDIEGLPVAADSWFPGYNWQYALCGGCRAHLGWYYAGDAADYFYGLIDQQLLELEK